MVNDKKSKGFAGLDSMVSEVGPAPELSIPSDRPEAATAARPATAPAAAEPAQTLEGSPKARSSGGPAVGWGLAIGVIALLLWLAIPGKPSSSLPAAAAEMPARTISNATTYDAPAPSAAIQSSTNVPAIAQNGSGAPSPEYSPAPLTVATYASNDETVPPVGTGLTLDRSQIRYCLSERIRVEAWQRQLNKYSQAAVDAFNASVNDYNTRCSSYRYRSGDLESVRAQVESNRMALTQQGLSKAAGIDVSVSAEQSTAIKTSFDCAKARSDAEHLICNDVQLAAADVELANLFAGAKAAVTDPNAFKEHAREQWNYRERSCHDRDCLVQWYANQRQWLTDIVSNSNRPAQPEEPATSQTSASPVGNCASTVACAKAMLMFASSENLAGAMEAAKTIDSLPKPRRGDRATARKLNQDGLSALNASRPDDAVKLLEQANQADPSDEEIVSNLAFAYAADGQLTKSEDTAVVALSLNPRRTNVWAPLAVTLAKANRLGQATQAMWLAYQFSTDKQRTLNFIDSRLAVETDPAVVKMYALSKDWLTENIKPNLQ